ncbi:MAG TPA: class I SAM-dependent RNA methyltransferase [Spirochaetales bacterium]|nr:class I SAM-dependent RNA methyltransferase [Spirochaetales bacterium]HRY53173.1 class I SAM-dependent RNA methyltransferase [Spirochaetia bacterium]HRZ63286.1 class I SAM-dependent RNA methyltransferase [Spirochaetia bacterium]
MADPQVLQLRVEKLVAGGDALAFHEGKAVFVPLALPGELVRAELRRSRRDFAQASLLEVLEPSPLRAPPECPIYGACGGCNLQHLAYPAQLEAKAAIVAEAFRRTGGIELGELEVRPSPPFGYRNRMQLHRSPRGRVGFMRRSSAEIVEAPGCPVAVAPIADWIAERAAGSGGLEGLGGPGGAGRFLAFGYGGELWLEGRRDLVEVAVAGQAIRFRLASFFQSNLQLLERFVPEALAGLGGGSAADLYCGVGLFGAFLARRFERVCCVEQDPAALGLARANVGAAGAEYHALAVEDWVRGPGSGKRFDCVLVDPPRSGLGAPVRAWLKRSKPPLLVYVSCDPVTLARDAADLLAGGFALESLAAYDFYPQTGHVECHARFVRA